MKKESFFLFVLLLLLNLGAKSQTSYVTNGSSTNWSTATAWTPNGVPVISGWPYDNVTINHSITYTGSTSVTGNASAIVINDGGSLTITGGLTNGNWGTPTPSINVKSGGTLTVAGTLELSGGDSINNSGTLNAGIFKISGGTTTITNSGAISVTNNFLLNSARTFKSTAGSISVGGAFTAGTAAGVLDISNTTISVTGTFSITGSARLTSLGPSLSVGGNLDNTGAVATVISGTVSVGGNINNTGSSDLTLNGTTTVGGGITGTGGTKITVNSTTTITGAVSLTGSAYMKGSGYVSWGSFSTDNSGSNIQCQDGTKFDTDAGSSPQPPGAALNLGTSCSFLPVELIGFSAEIIEKKKVQLNWSTASEINSNYFVIEHSSDGINFNAIAEVAGGGNSNSVLNYSFVHEYPVTGINYYRLRQFDYDGTSELFNKLAIECKNELGKMYFKASPNIIDTETNFSFESFTSEIYTIKVFDEVGKALETISISAEKGSNNFSFSFSSYRSGYYFAQLISEKGKIEQLKLLKK